MTTMQLESLELTTTELLVDWLLSHWDETPATEATVTKATPIITVAPTAIAPSPDTFHSPSLPEGWDLDKRGKPLRGAALEARRRKLLRQLE